MAEEPDFEVYDKARADMPDSVEELWELDDDYLEEVSPDEVVSGYEELMEFLDETAEKETVEKPSGEEVVVSGENNYWWAEVDVDSAPEREICGTCGKTKRTRSEERVDELRHMHHVATGH